MEMKSFLEQVGFVHLRAVLDAAEIEALRSDVNDALRTARPDDRKSWWTTVGGREVCNRVNYLNEGSARIAGLGADPRFLDIAALGGPELERCAGPPRREQRRHQGAGSRKRPGRPSLAPRLRHGRPSREVPHAQRRNPTRCCDRIQRPTPDDPGLAPRDLPTAERSRGTEPPRGGRHHRAGRCHRALRTHPACDATSERPARFRKAGAVPLVRATSDLRDGRSGTGVQRRALHPQRRARAARRSLQLSEAQSGRCTLPSAASTQPGLCATSHGCPSRSMNTPE